MTEKNKDWMPEALSEQEQQQLADDQEFLMRQFSALCCPALPEGLSAQNIWEKICAGEGDGQITVDPSTIDVQMEGTEEKETVLESETENPSKEKNNVIIFPQKKEQQEKVRTISAAQRRRRWAIACTLVLVVGLSAAFWKYGRTSMNAGGAIVQNTAAADQATEEAVEESAEVEETVEAVEEESATQEAAMPKAVMQQTPQAANEAPQTESGTTSADSVQPQSEPSAQSNDAPAVQSDAAGNQQDTQEREELRQRMLDSLASPQQEKAVTESTVTEQQDEEQVNPTTGGEGETPKAEPQTGVMMAQAPQEQTESESAQPETETTTEAANALEEGLKQAQQSKVQTYSVKGGSLSYDPSTATMTVLYRNGEQAATVQLAANAQVLASERSFAELVSDEQANTVTMTVYSLEELSKPEKVNSICHQGTLFDIYQSGTDSYTLMTSVWFTREQIEAGDFLPTIDNSEIELKKINIIEGYGQQEEINYLLTSTLTMDSTKTRADLYLK